MAKDRELGDVIKAQILLYPCTSPNSDYPSYKIYEDGENILPAKFVEYVRKMYYPKPLADLQNPYATPLIASSEQVKGLPPALVITAECDVLRDESEAYTGKLLEAGVDAIAIRVLGATHGFMTFLGPLTPQYTYTFKTVINFIRDQLNLS